MMDEGTGNLSAIDVNARVRPHRRAPRNRRLCRRDGVHGDVARQIRAAGPVAASPTASFGRGSTSTTSIASAQLRLTRLVQIRDMPSAIADRAFMQVVYGTHPYAHMALGTEESLRQLTHRHGQDVSRAAVPPVERDADRVGRHRRRRVQPDGVGRVRDLDRTARPEIPDDAAIVAAAVGAGPSAGHRRQDRARRKARFASARSGCRANTPDYHPLIVLNMILGGQFVSRINMKLRQEKGLTYGARTAFDFRRGRGPFILQTSVQSDGTGEAIRSSLLEIHAIRTDRPPTADEVEVAKAALTRGYPRNFETAEQIARAMAQLVLYGLPDDYFDTFTSQVCGCDGRWRPGRWRRRICIRTGLQPPSCPTRLLCYRSWRLRDSGNPLRYCPDCRHMRSSRLSVSLSAGVAVIAAIFAGALIWLLLSDPVTVADAVETGEVGAARSRACRTSSTRRC